MQGVFKRNGGMKQTAVDYLHERYMYVTWLRNRDEISANKADDFRKMYLELAKRMEKEQMIEFANSFYDNCGLQYGGLEKSAEQYYNENYGNK
jgi:hypothetical protein